MYLPQATEILIVGAGPTGLACALSLHKQGCRDITIVDAVEQGENTSRALAVHSATLEALDNICCAQRLVEAGVRNQCIKAWDDSKLLTLADWAGLKPYTKYPFVLTVSQHVTEQILGEQVQKAGITVRRPFRVVSMNPHEHDANLATVSFDSGHAIQARYIIGADGAKSVVRQTAGIGFQDPASTQKSNGSLDQMVFADVSFAQPLPTQFNDPLFVFTPNNVFLNIPLAAHTPAATRTYRIGSGIPTSMGTPPPSPPKSYLQNLVDTYGIGITKDAKATRGHERQFAIEQVLWSTRFRTHCSIADTFFTRLDRGGHSQPGAAILLIGDAAHIHPPAGGQGMNLGLRDAISLGQVLGEQIARAGAVDRSPELCMSLRAWADHRRQQGLTIIKLTRSLLWVAGLPRARSITWIWGIVPVNLASVRDCVLWVLDKSSWLKNKVAWRLSGLGNR